MIQSLLINAFFAAIAGIGFGIAFNPPKKMLLMSGLFSAIGHTFRLWLMNGCDMNICAATFLAAAVIGVLGFIAGRISGSPSEVYTFPAVLPMIPGIYAYRTLLAVVKFFSEPVDSELSTRFLQEFLSNGLIAISVMLAIVLGVAASAFTDNLSDKIENRKMRLRVLKK